MRQEFYDVRALEIMECAERGISKSRTAAKLGLCVATVRKYAKLYSIEFSTISGGIDEGDLRAAASEGLSRLGAARRFGVSYSTIHQASKKLGIEFDRPGKGPANAARADAMAAMFQAGKTLEEIGSVFGVTRERVRQIITKYRGITGENGGQHVRAKIESERRRAQREAECYQKHGCSTAQLRELHRVGREMMKAGETAYRTPVRAYRSQRNNAIGRGIHWDIKLWEWWRIWQQSGKWDKRGRHGDSYVMCRFRDEGPYTIGNVYIATLRHNSAIQPNNPYRKDHPDFANVIQLRARTAKTCSEAGCSSRHYAKGLCQSCYKRLRYRELRGVSA